jgi:hypothetical protein
MLAFIHESMKVLDSTKLKSSPIYYYDDEWGNIQSMMAY